MHDRAIEEEGKRIIQALQQLPDSQRHDRLMRYMSSLIRQLLALEPTEPLEARQRLFEMGFQSRTVIELKSCLEASFAVLLPVTLFFHHPTLEQLTTALLHKLALADGHSRKPLEQRLSASPATSQQRAEAAFRVKEKMMPWEKGLSHEG